MSGSSDTHSAEPPPAESSSPRATAAAVVALVVLVFVVFHPMLGAAFGSSDDYTCFTDVKLAPTGCLSVVRGAGRPVLAALYEAAVSRLDRFSDLSRLRFIYLALVAASGAAVVASARRAGLPAVPAFAAAALYAVSLPVVDLAALTPSFVVPLGVVAAALAFRLWAVGRPVTAAAAAVLLVFAYSIYQTAALMWFYFLALDNFARPGARPDAVRRILHGFGLILAATVAYYFLVMVGYTRFVGVPVTERAVVSRWPANAPAATGMPSRL